MREISKSAEEDLELIAAIKEEKGIAAERAYSKLFKKYNDSMTFFFRKHTKDEQAAKELVLEAFAKASASIEKYDSESAVFSTWMFKLTRNLFIDSLRKKKEETVSLSDFVHEVEENTPFEYEIPDFTTPEDRIITSEKSKRIASVVNNMKNKELAELIRMRYFDGMSYEKMSIATGKPLGTIKVSLFRAKEILRKEFTEIGLIYHTRKCDLEDVAERKEKNHKKQKINCHEKSF